MTVGFTELNTISAYDTSNLTTFVTGVLTALANKLYVVKASASYNTAGTSLTSITGGGLGTWNIETGARVENSGLNRCIEAAWMWSSSPGSAEAISINWNAATTGAGWTVWEITGFNTSDPIGLVDKLTANGVTSLAPFLSSATPGSGLLASCRTNAEQAMTAEAGWTPGSNPQGGSPAFTMLSAYRTDISDLSCTFNWSTAGPAVGNIIEINAAVEATKSPPFDAPSRKLQSLLAR